MIASSRWKRFSIVLKERSKVSCPLISTRLKVIRISLSSSYECNSKKKTES